MSSYEPCDASLAHVKMSIRPVRIQLQKSHHLTIAVKQGRKEFCLVQKTSTQPINLLGHLRRRPCCTWHQELKPIVFPKPMIPEAFLVVIGEFLTFDSQLLDGNYLERLPPSNHITDLSPYCIRISISSKSKACRSQKSSNPTIFLYPSIDHQAFKLSTFVFVMSHVTI
jgi:hypothetical protein